MQSLEEVLAQYDYAFPKELIAQAPASPRDSSQLVVVDRRSGSVVWTHFREIGTHLPRSAVLVLNKTKVIPAKLILTRADGKTVEVLSLGSDGVHLRVMASRKLQEGEVLSLGTGETLTVTGQDERYRLLKPSFPIEQLHAVFERAGTMPLPPYIDQSPLSPDELKQRYQSVFAQDAGSIAAPTASLHFTEELLATLQKNGVRIAYVTLHVHLGTFAKLTEQQWQEGKLHEESYSIDPASASLLTAAKNAGDPVVAVGTTAVRALETAFDDSFECVRPSGTTRLFIREGYRFRMPDAMITNFHVPKSTLLMLVCAFAGRGRIMQVYAEAVQRRLRLFSFGDAMLIL